MSTTTTNLGLTKQTGSEYYSIDVVNTNLDKIDAGCVNTSTAQTIAGIKTFTDGITAYPRGWHNIAKTGMTQGKYYKFAEINNTNNGCFHILEFQQSSNTSMSYGKLLIRGSTSDTTAVWLVRQDTGANSTLSLTAIYVGVSNSKICLAWKKESPYGNIMWRATMGNNYSAILTNEANITALEDTSIVELSDLSSWTNVQNPFDGSVHSYGNETISGNKTFVNQPIFNQRLNRPGTDTSQFANLQCTDDDKTVVPSATIAYPKIRFADKNDVFVGAIEFRHNTDGTYSIVGIVLNANGTQKQVELVKGNA